MAPNLEIETPELPDVSQTQNVGRISATWWKQFNDPQLDLLVDEALRSSDNLKLAVANVALARATLGLSTAERYPDIYAEASAYRQRTSAESLSPFGGVIYNTFGLSATIGYEFDFWGKFKNAEEAAWSQLVASEADKETLRMSLISGVAELYITQIALVQKVRLLEETVDAYRQSYEYRQREYRHGVIDELTVEQSNALYESARVTLASTREAKALNESALALLIGYDPKRLFETSISAPLTLPAALSIPEGIDSHLLERRPDIRASEERLRAANATIGVAKADYFPAISLTGTLGVQSIDLENLLQSSARTWGVGPSLSVPLLDFGRVKSGVESAEAQKEAAQISYAKTVKNAFKEVYDALKRIEYTKAQIAANRNAVQALEKVLVLSEKRFDNGYGSYLDVLVAKRSLLNSRTALIDLDAAQITNQIVLYKALGGGWDTDEKEVDASIAKRPADNA